MSLGLKCKHIYSNEWTNERECDYQHDEQKIVFFFFSFCIWIQISLGSLTTFSFQSKKKFIAKYLRKRGKPETKKNCWKNEKIECITIDCDFNNQNKHSITYWTVFQWTRDERKNKYKHQIFATTNKRQYFFKEKQLSNSERIEKIIIILFFIC